VIAFLPGGLASLPRALSRLRRPAIPIVPGPAVEPGGGEGLQPEGGDLDVGPDPVRAGGGPTGVAAGNRPTDGPRRAESEPSGAR
jgi:hypothetical protein